MQLPTLALLLNNPLEISQALNLFPPTSVL
jgi:hypothetical protein